jgi:hypothetical protein
MRHKGWKFEAASRLIVNGQDVRSVADHDDRTFRFRRDLPPEVVAWLAFSAGVVSCAGSTVTAPSTKPSRI